MSNVLDELSWRGLISQTTSLDALREALENGPITYYCGFDPTAPSLHHGHLVQLVVLKHLQLAGHHPIALVGGATGLIGDPRMSGERVLNSRDIVGEWVQRLQQQISRFLDFSGENPAIMVNNLDWTGQLTAIDFLRDIGQHYRLGTMLAKETVARRLASDQGISFTEFSYQILQGLDFLELFRRHGCSLQTGGNDQWGNLLSGVELIRKSEHSSVHALATPLITKADGTKFGKSEGGAVWLDPTMMSPYAFYQFWLNADDADVVGYLKIFTFRSQVEIAEIAQQHAQRPAARHAQQVLAADVTTLVHGSDATQQVISASQALFGRGDLKDLDEATLLAAVSELPVAYCQVGVSIVDAMVECTLVTGKNLARRAIADGGVQINNIKITPDDDVLTADHFLHDKAAVIRKGKKTLAVVMLTKG